MIQAVKYTMSQKNLHHQKDELKNGICFDPNRCTLAKAKAVETDTIGTLQCINQFTHLGLKAKQMCMPQL